MVPFGGLGDSGRSMDGSIQKVVVREIASALQVYELQRMSCVDVWCVDKIVKIELHMGTPLTLMPWRLRQIQPVDVVYAIFSMANPSRPRDRIRLLKALCTAVYTGRLYKIARCKMTAGKG